MRKTVCKLGEIFRRFKIEIISLSSAALEVDISYTNYDAEAAWILYIELVTRVTTQPLNDDCGIEKSALDSVYSLFAVTRDVLKMYGRNAKSFTRIAIIVLNQIIRPFTSKWHVLSENGCFNDKERCKEFRNELKDLQVNLVNYARLLADMAKVDDLTEL